MRLISHIGLRLAHQNWSLCIALSSIPLAMPAKCLLSSLSASLIAAEHSSIHIPRCSHRRWCISLSLCCQSGYGFPDSISSAEVLQEDGLGSITSPLGKISRSSLIVAVLTCRLVSSSLSNVECWLAAWGYVKDEWLESSGGVGVLDTEMMGRIFDRV